MDCIYCSHSRATFRERKRGRVREIEENQCFFCLILSSSTLCVYPYYCSYFWLKFKWWRPSPMFGLSLETKPLCFYSLGMWCNSPKVNGVLFLYANTSIKRIVFTFTEDQQWLGSNTDPSDSLSKSTFCTCGTYGQLEMLNRINICPVPWHRQRKQTNTVNIAGLFSPLWHCLRILLLSSHTTPCCAHFLNETDKDSKDPSFHSLK